MFFAFVDIDIHRPVIQELRWHLTAIYKYGMEPNEFKRRLEELAEIQPRREPRSAGRREVDEPTEIFRNGSSTEIDLENNHTLTLVIKQLRNSRQICEDCDRFVERRTINYKLLDYPQKHWRASCKNCQKTLNPRNGNFDLSCVKAGAAYADFFKQEKEPICTVNFKKPTK